MKSPPPLEDSSNKRAGGAKKSYRKLDPMTASMRESVLNGHAKTVIAAKAAKKSYAVVPKLLKECDEKVPLLCITRDDIMNAVRRVEAESKRANREGGSEEEASALPHNK